ncbi:MAG: MATE family efflux transporter [Lachnospiraceae bacterium]|nr:MATE family efflux transporter [Lachnospiraceae bacterium]
MSMQERNVPVENKMGTMPVGKLLITMSLPMMASMLVQALYNIVDSIFVARIDEDALTAVSLAFPIQTLMIGMGVGLGVGMNAVLSKALGEKDEHKVTASAMNALFMTLVNIAVFILIGLFVVGPFYRVQTTDAEIVSYGIDYLTIVCCFSTGIFFQVIFEKILQSTGRTVESMVSQLIGAVINLIFDPILIFGLLGFPRLGVKGAAIATVAGQFAGATAGLLLNLKRNPDVRFHIKGFRPSGHMIREIYRVGLPSIFMQCVGSVMTYCLNQILIVFSTTATAVFGVYFKLQSFIFMPLFGMNSGMVPIIAFNYGARNKKRMMQTIRFATVIAVCIMLVGVFVFQVFPQDLFLLFDASDHMLSMGVPALRIISLHFPIAAFCIVMVSTFQALGNGTYSLIVSLIRQIAVLLPAAYLLSLLGEVTYVWWAFPIAEVSSLIVSAICMILIYRNVISKVDEVRVE